MKKHISVINLKYLEEAFVGSQEAVIEVINIFLDTMPGEMEQLKIAIQDTNQEQVQQRAHKVKASFLIIGMSKAAELCLQLETAAKNNSMPDFQALLLSLQEEFSLGYDELKQYAKTIVDNR